MNLEFVEKKVVKSYDNEGAMQTVKAMMKRGEQLDVKFYTNKDNYPCAWIGSKKIQGFCLILNQEGLSWLRTYLETGEAEDFGPGRSRRPRPEPSSVAGRSGVPGGCGHLDR